jgi:hypothetical protein
MSRCRPAREFAPVRQLELAQDRGRQRGNQEQQRQDSGAAAGYSMTVLAMAGGSRPAISHPAHAAASGTPKIASARYCTGTELR